MFMQSIRLRAAALAASLALLMFCGPVQADPPSRVARLGYTSGAISFSPAGEADWVQASVNRPLGTGDRLWADADGRTEIQLGGAMVRMSANTGVSVLNLDDRITQLQLSEGTLNVRVLRLARDQVFEVDTPNLAFTLRQPGVYRIAVTPDGNATDIVVRQGQGEAYGEGAAYLVDTRQAYRFTGTGLREYQTISAAAPDAFDRWTGERDRAFDRSESARYVSANVIGYQDLDAHGSWRRDPSYGSVWVPDRVGPGWAPYRDGHWAWVDPWGWTWIDDAPWGFAVSHYGRWAHLRDTWAWVPGPVQTPAWYAPALVAFVGGSNLQLTISGGNVGGVAWFPLAPREVYQPPYATSRGYFENVNRSNTVVNNTVINNYYNTTNVTNVVYANRSVPGAVIAVPTSTFVQSQPVARSIVRATPEMAGAAPVANTAPVAPTERSVQGAGDKPPQHAFERPVVTHNTPPAARAGFAAQQPQLAARPGRPLDDTARKDLTPAATVPTPAVTVVAQAKAAPPTKAPPPPAHGAAPLTPNAPPVQAPRASETRPVTPPVTAAPTVTAAPPALRSAVPQQTTKPEPAAAAAVTEPAKPLAAPKPPPPRAAEPRASEPRAAGPLPALPAVAVPAALTQAAPQHATPPQRAAPPPQAAPPAPVAPPAAVAPPAHPAPATGPTKPEPATAAKPVAPHVPVSAPRTPASAPPGQQASPEGKKPPENAAKSEAQKREEKMREEEKARQPG